MLENMIGFIIVTLLGALLIRFYRAKALGKHFFKGAEKVIVGMCLVIGVLTGSLILLLTVNGEDTVVEDSVIAGELLDNQLYDDMQELDKSLTALDEARKNEVHALIPTRVEEVQRASKAVVISATSFENHMSDKYLTTDEQDEALRQITKAGLCYQDYADEYLLGLESHVLDNSYLDYLRNEAEERLKGAERILKETY